MPEMQKPGIVITVIGIVGVFVSFVIQKGELDPIALGISIASIFLAIMGISWILGSPEQTKKPSKTRRRRGKR